MKKETLQAYIEYLEKQRQDLLNYVPSGVEEVNKIMNEVKTLNFKINDLKLQKRKTNGNNILLEMITKEVRERLGN